MNALKVFTACIRYLKEHLLEHGTRELKPSEIHWVLTVPAIWEDAAKQFMREAAVAAGIQSENLSLALEPEVASVYCRHTPLDRLKGEENDASSSFFQSGTRYLVLDAGGGTVDITVHETEEDGNVKEIYKANGGPWGGTTVDDAFRTFLVDVLTDDVLQDVLKHNQNDCLQFFQEFEIKKRTFDTEKNQATFKLPISFFEAYRRIHKRDFSILRVKQSIQPHVKLSKDKVRVDAQIIKRLFDPTCIHIVQHLREIFKMSTVQNTNAILMVGGFSESVLLQHAVREAFPDKRIIVPEEAGLAVVKGAVIFGHNPFAITARVARRTYGVKTYYKFDSARHPLARIEMVNEVAKCKDCFDKHVEIGQIVKVGEAFETKTYFPLYRSQTKVAISIYTSLEKDPLFADVPPCTFLGKIDVDLSTITSGEDKSMIVKMTYGEPELGLEVKVPKTGELLKAKFDFLG